METQTFDFSNIDFHRTGAQICFVITPLFGGTLDVGCCGGGEGDDGDHCEEEKNRENGEEWELFHEVAPFEGGAGGLLLCAGGLYLYYFKIGEIARELLRKWGCLVWIRGSRLCVLSSGSCYWGIAYYYETGMYL